MLPAIRSFATPVTLVLLTGILFAEVPPLREDKLKARAAVIVTGTVTAVKAGKAKPGRGSTETPYDLTIRVDKVEKGKVKEGAKTIVARGLSIRLKPGFAGSGGHYADKTYDRIAAVGKGWRLKLYLKEPKDGVYDILFPNGFEVLQKPSGK